MAFVIVGVAVVAVVAVTVTVAVVVIFLLVHGTELRQGLQIFDSPKEIKKTRSPNKIQKYFELQKYSP